MNCGVHLGFALTGGALEMALYSVAPLVVLFGLSVGDAPRGKLHFADSTADTEELLLSNSAGADAAGSSDFGTD